MKLLSKTQTKLEFLCRRYILPLLESRLRGNDVLRNYLG